MDCWIFKRWLQGSKFIGLKSYLHHWKALRTYMSKMGLHYSFGYLKHKLWQNKRPLKVENRPNVFACKWRDTYYWKALDKAYIFSLDLISIRGLHTKLWVSKVMGVPILGISGLQLRSPETKWHLGVGPMARHKIYYKGEGGDFPPVRAVVSLVNLCLPLPCLCTKGALAMH
jgi:hypothetical protein